MLIEMRGRTVSRILRRRIAIFRRWGTYFPSAMDVWRYLRNAIDKNQYSSLTKQTHMSYIWKIISSHWVLLKINLFQRRSFLFQIFRGISSSSIEIMHYASLAFPFFELVKLVVPVFFSCKSINFRKIVWRPTARISSSSVVVRFRCLDTVFVSALHQPATSSRGPAGETRSCMLEFGGSNRWFSSSNRFV